jgi:hypothetical protein
MRNPQDFVEWVCDPSRTNDELFTVELLIEHRRSSPNWPFPERQQGFDTRMETMRSRGEDPGYRPGLDEAEIEQLITQAADVRVFHGGSAPDRPLRDLKALAFFPALTNLSLNGDLSDLSPLASLPHLKLLSISQHSELAGSQPLRLGECGEMRELEHFFLSLRQPWPDVRAIKDWPALLEFRFNGNVLVWEEVPALPTPRLVHLKGGNFSNTPLRDLRTLPEMPATKQLVIEGATLLEGIERYPSVVNLELGGTFHDLTPMAAMTNITALSLTGEFFHDLSPLSRLPNLREVRLVRERAIDLSPLADCPQLRRVAMERCAMMRTEVAALNAGLLPEAPDFEAEKPRAVGPLKFFTTSPENEAGIKFFQKRSRELREVREQSCNGDAAFAQAEARTLVSTLQGRLDQLLGRGWGLLRSCKVHPGIEHIPFKRFSDTSRLREVIQVLREISAHSRFEWEFLLIVEPHGDMSEDLKQMKAREEEEAVTGGDWLAQYYEPESVLRENEERRRERERRYEFLAREHLLQLRGEQEGLDPALFYVPREETESVKEEETITPSSAADEDDDGGGVALAPPPPPPLNVDNLGDELEFYLTVYEDCILVNSHWLERASYNLGMTAVEWTSDSETR